MQLYDINSRKLIESVEETKTLDGNFNSEDYTLELTIPTVTESKFRLYYKIYEKGKESRICLETKKDVEIDVSDEPSCDDDDRDNYKDKSCGGNDCKDNDKAINPGAAEICTDSMDNNCNGLIDNLDSACITTTCTAGTTRDCGKGVCKGTQTCSNNAWGSCSGSQAGTEQCNNNLDDDCDGFTDSNDGDCGGTGFEEDSDDDGLSDNWEQKYFGNLNKNAEDDSDGDGFTNLQEYKENTDPSDENDYPEKQDGKLITTVLIAIGVVLIAIILVWFFAIRPRKLKPEKMSFERESIRKPFMQKEATNPVLKDYIENSLRKGYNKEQIKKALLAKGWKDHEIERVFRK